MLEINIMRYWRPWSAGSCTACASAGVGKDIMRRLDTLNRADGIMAEVHAAKIPTRTKNVRVQRM
jgi:hypothetical protein